MSVVLAAVLVAFDLFVLWSLWRGAPYIPTKNGGVAKIVAASQIRPGQKMMDIGSGDGRILIAMAKAGAEAHGIENNPLLVRWSRHKIRLAGQSAHATVKLGDLWGTDYSSYDVLTLFGAPHLMQRLEKKLRQELKPGARVISLAFTFPTWPLEQQIDGIYIYKR